MLPDARAPNLSKAKFVHSVKGAITGKYIVMQDCETVVYETILFYCAIISYLVVHLNIQIIEN